MEEELINELQFNNKWLTPEYKDSKEYRHYLAVVFKQLIKATWQNADAEAQSHKVELT